MGVGLRKLMALQAELTHSMRPRSTKVLVLAVSVNLVISDAVLSAARVATFRFSTGSDLVDVENRDVMVLCSPVMSGDVVARG